MSAKNKAQTDLAKSAGKAKAALAFVPPAAKAALAKAQAEGPTKKRAGPEEVEGQLAQKPRYSDGQLRSQCTEFFSRVATGKVAKATTVQVAEAHEALETMASLDERDKTEFAKAFYSNKGTKDFGFVKDYTQKVTAVKKVSQDLEENYFTRTT